MTSLLQRCSGLTCMVALALMAIGCPPASGKFIWVDDYRGGSPSDRAGYVIQPGDLLDVRVFQHDNMSARVRVRSDGKVSMPFLNDVDAAGYTPVVLAQQ